MSCFMSNLCYKESIGFKEAVIFLEKTKTTLSIYREDFPILCILNASFPKNTGILLLLPVDNLEGALQKSTRLARWVATQFIQFLYQNQLEKSQQLQKEWERNSYICNLNQIRKIALEIIITGIVIVLIPRRKVIHIFSLWLLQKER